MKVLLIFLISISQCFALDVTPIKKGDPAPQNGFFIDAENMQEMRKINEEKKLLNKENVTLKDLAIINESRISTYQEYVKKSSDDANWEKTKGTAKGIAGFLIGIGSAALAGYVMMKASK